MSLSARWFVLKNTDVDFPTVQAALATADAAKFGGTWNQSTRVCSFDSTLTIIGSLVTDAELTGDLAALQRANEGTGVFIQELQSQAHKDAIVFDFLGESGKTAYFIKNNWAQASVGATPTAVSTGAGGRTLADAVAWEDFDGLTPSEPATVWVLGDQIPVANSGFTTGDLQNTMLEGASASLKTAYRFDYPGRRGCMYGGLLAGAHVTWTDAGVSPGGGTGHIWTATLPVNCFSLGFVMDPGFPQGEFGTFLVGRATEAAMQNNVNSHWAANYNSGSTVKLHLPAGEDPTNRVMLPPATADTKQFDLFPLDFATNPPKQFVEFYECKRRIVGDRGQWRIDGAVFRRGLNSEVSMDVDGSSDGKECIFINLDQSNRWGTGQTYTGWSFDGLRLRRGSLGFLFNRQLFSPNNTMDTGFSFKDIDGEDIGGHDPNYDHADGHVIGFQGAAKNISVSGSLRCVNNGGPINFYAFTQNDANPANIVDQAFAGLTMDCDNVDIRGHAEFNTLVPLMTNDVGIHLAGDVDQTGDFSNVSITLTGTIKDFSRQIRIKWPHQILVTSHTSGGLVLSKGASSHSDAVGVYCQVGTPVYSVTLSGSSGNWNVGDALEDPASAGNAIAIITKVIGSNPTVTLQYRDVDIGAAPYFSDTQTVANLSDTGTGTANGDGAFLGDIAGNAKLRKIRFESDLDTFYEHAGTDNPDGNPDEGVAVGFHVDSDENIFVGTTTGKFDSLHGASQSLSQWQANSVGGNVYDPNSTNPSS